MKILKNKISIFILLGILLIGGILFYNSSQKAHSQILSKEKAIQKAIDYIKSLKKDEEVNLEESSEESGLYKFKIKIGEQEYISYISKDGKLLFPQAIVLETEIPKRKKPDVKLFVMSYCPFGLQAEKALIPVYNLLKDKADIGIYFVDYIMHGEKEMEENLRQYCIQQENKSSYFVYLNCFVESGDYQKCLDSVKIDQEKISQCVENTKKEFNIEENQNERFPEFPIHKELNKKYGVKGSPTLVINDMIIEKIKRSPEGFKKAICESFKKSPKECLEKLSEETASPGFGKKEGSHSEGFCK